MPEGIKILTVVGARPQFIKAAALSRAFAGRDEPDGASAIQEVLLHTGQHYDDNMSRVFFDELEIPRPQYNLAIGSASHAVQTARMLEGIERVLLDEKPDLVLLYGDTNSTLAGALAAAKLRIRVAHVEAGMRSFNRSMPEEVNRVLADHVSDLLFCPTATAIENLAREGMEKGVHLVGDVMLDCALYYREKSRSIEKDLLDGLGIRPKAYRLATVHRAENADDPLRLEGILEGLSALSTRACPVVAPLHPRTNERIARFGLKTPDNLKLVPPVTYLQMIALENNALTILTDSGGVQKEAYICRVPCVTIRGETEWVETVDTGWNVLVAPVSEDIVKAAGRDVSELDETWKPLFGKGDAAENIRRILLYSEFGGQL